MKLKTLLKYNSSVFNRLPIAEKMQVVRYLEKVGNARINAIQQKGLAGISSALHSRNSHKFHTPMPERPENVRKSRKENLEKRLNEAFSNAKSFLTAKSSTLTGLYKTMRKASEDFEAMDALLTASKSQQNKFWKAYNTLKDLDITLLKSMNYEKRRQMLFDIMVKRTKTGQLRFKNIDDAVKEMTARMKEDYERSMMKQYDEEEAESDFETKMKFETLNIWDY